MMVDLGATMLAAFIAGFLGSAHCLVMCTGIVATLNLNTKTSAPITHQSLRYNLLYNLGRIFSYSLGGALVAGLGVSLFWLTGLMRLRFVLQLASGLALFVLGVYIFLNRRGFAWLDVMGLYLWRRLAPLLKHVLPITNPARAIAAGMLWGWLPCGMVYALLMMAWLSADVISGACIMVAFGLGTLPALLLTGVAIKHTRQILTSIWARRVGGLCVMVAGGLVTTAPWWLDHNVAQSWLFQLNACLPSWMSVR
jgi:sulfite exporter TauE/SafE